MTTTPAPLDLDSIRAEYDQLRPESGELADKIPPLLAALTAAREELAKVRAELDRQERAHGETIDDRDACHEAADKLAEAIAAAAGVDIGEHSNMNDPWANALDAMPKLVAELSRVTRERHDAADLLRTIWYGTVNAPARETWLRLIAEANSATTAEPCDSMNAHDPHGRCPGARSAFTERYPSEEPPFVCADFWCERKTSRSPADHTTCATTAEPAACTCATWREETPYGLQTITGPDATCPVHGEEATAEPADDQAYHYDLTAPQHNVAPDAACNCQSTDGGGPWHPMGDTQTCPKVEPADEPKAT